MRTKSGDYGGFMLYICQGMNGALSEITGGAENLINRGAVVQAVALPVNKVYASGVANNEDLSTVQETAVQDINHKEVNRAEDMSLLYRQTADKDSYSKAFTPEELAKVKAERTA